MRQILEFQHVEDYVQLYLTEGTILSIYNPIQVENAEEEDVCGHFIIGAIKKECSLHLYLDGDISIEVSLLDQDYTGPEAMILHFEGRPDIVWN